MRVARWGLGLVLVLAACGGRGTDGPPPAVAANPNGDAFLAVVRGEVWVTKADGTRVPATEEMVLDRSDTLVTGEGGRVVVVLYNNYVLKLDAQLSKRVGELAHFGDPPPSESLGELFEQALGAEYEALDGKERLVRIAGWNARQAAGETRAPIAREPPAQAPPPKVEADQAKLEVKESGSIGLGQTGTVGRGAGGTAEDAPVADAKSADDGGKASKIRPSDPRRAPDHEQGGEAAGDTPGAEAAEPLANPKPPGSTPSDPEVATKKAGADLEDELSFKPESGETRRIKLPEPLASRRFELALCLAGAGRSELVLEVAGEAIRAVTPESCGKGLIGKTLAGVGTGTVTVKPRK